MADQSQHEKAFPPQRQTQQPGSQAEMQPQPISISSDYRGSHKLRGKVALISGGDSGIGRAVALHFAREGAAVAFIYCGQQKQNSETSQGSDNRHGSDDSDDDDKEKRDADETVHLIEAEQSDALALQGDVSDKSYCEQAVAKVIEEFGALDILVNNAGEQHVQQNLEAISPEQLQKTFATNIFSYFYLTQAALPHLEKAQGAIINTGSVTSFKGNPKLIDYTATKGAIQAFTFALAKSLADKKIRVNEVAPGPIWTPLIPATFTPEQVSQFGSDTLMKRAGQPCEVAPAYVFLASADSAYITGQIIHVNGGGYLGV
ncbi:MAG TPA: SDR family oxidoreductase [Spongiibacteraceae bacterium]